MQSSYFFININTWKVISARHWIELPFTKDIIDKVNNRGRSELGLSPDDPVPEEFVFKYLDGTIVGATFDTNSGGRLDSNTAATAIDVNEEGSTTPETQAQDDESDDEEEMDVTMPASTQAETNETITRDNDEYDELDETIKKEEKRHLLERMNQVNEEDDASAEGSTHIKTEELDETINQLNQQTMEMENHIKEGLEILNEQSSSNQTHDQSQRMTTRNAKMDFSYRFGMKEGNNQKGTLLNIVKENMREYIAY